MKIFYKPYEKQKIKLFDSLFLRDFRYLKCFSYQNIRVEKVGEIYFQFIFRKRAMCKPIQKILKDDTFYPVQIN